MSRPALLMLLALLACDAAPAHPPGPLALKQRLLLPPARVVDDPALPNPLAGLGTGGHGVVEDRLEPTFEGLVKVSLAERRTGGECDVFRGVLLRGERALEIPAFRVEDGDVVAFYTGALARRRKRSPLRPKPVVHLRATADDGSSLTGRVEVDTRHGDRWKEARFDLSRLAGRTVSLEVRLGGAWREEDDHAFVADLALFSSRPEAQRAARPNVVLIWLDKFRADLLEQNGGPPGWVPHLDALARESVNFTRARSGANHTRNGVLQTFFSTMSVNDYATSGDAVDLPSLSSELARAGYYSVTLGTNTYTTTFLPEWGVEQIDARHDRARV
ncbi:MAG: sulfatase-like hydrolase/transferase, partial [Myxococcales bacterium]